MKVEKKTSLIFDFQLLMTIVFYTTPNLNSDLNSDSYTKLGGRAQDANAVILWVGAKHLVFLFNTSFYNYEDF